MHCGRADEVICSADENVAQRVMDITGAARTARLAMHANHYGRLG